MKVFMCGHVRRKGDIGQISTLEYASNCANVALDCYRSTPESKFIFINFSLRFKVTVKTQLNKIRN